MSDYINKTLEEAINLHNNGELEAAGDLYRAVLEQQKDNRDAMHLLGMARYRQGAYCEGIGLVAAAHRLKPFPLAYNNLMLLMEDARKRAMAFQVEGKTSEADELYRVILEERPHKNLVSVDILNNIVRMIVTETTGNSSTALTSESFNNIIYSVAHNQHTPQGQAMIYIARNIMNAVGCASPDFFYNGEFWLLWKLSQFPIKTVFDVGANIGQWASMAYGHLPAAQIYSFEVLPATFAGLREKTAAMPRIQPVNLGLLDQVCAAPVHFRNDRDNDVAASVFPIDGGDGAQECQFTTGAVFAGQHNISQIDILKLDIEGAEVKALLGFGDLLREGRIALIQFEYSQVNVSTRVLLKDFYDLLAPFGYRLGKLRSDGVFFKDFEADDEDFMGPNVVACHQSRGDLLAAISAPRP